MLFSRLTLILFLSFLVLPTQTVFAIESQCLVTRAAFDLGSSRTKMKVAKVDRCSHKVLEVLVDEAKPVAFRDELDRSKDGKFGESLQNEGVEALQLLKSKAIAASATEFSGVATAAFRKALNGQAYADSILSKTGISIRILSQKEEGIAGYLSATTQLTAEQLTHPILVWEIGGGSSQITRLNASPEVFDVYEGQLGSANFKNILIETIQKKSLQTTPTPNPISLEQASQAETHVSQYATTSTSETLRFWAKQTDTLLIGVGGVHSQGIKNQIDKNSATYTLAQVYSVLSSKAGLTDEQIGGKFASTDVSNLILVAGYLKALGANKVLTLNTELTDGLLIQSNLWPQIKAPKTTWENE